MPTYFGYTTVGGSFDLPLFASAGYWVRNKNYTIGFFCPGTNQQVVKEISAYVSKVANIPNIRLAIYDSSHNLICQGSTEIPIVVGPSWQGHLLQTNIIPNPAYLIGGVQYDLILTHDDPVGFSMFYNIGNAGDYTQDDANQPYVAGFPNFLADGANLINRINIRCGVDPVESSAMTIGRRRLRRQHF